MTVTSLYEKVESILHNKKTGAVYNRRTNFMLRKSSPITNDVVKLSKQTRQELQFINDDSENAIMVRLAWVIVGLIAVILVATIIHQFA